MEESSMNPNQTNKRILGTGMMFLLVASTFLIGFQLATPGVEAYTTPGSGVNWNMDDLVTNSGGAVTAGALGVYYVHQTIVIETGDTLNMRDNEEVYIDPGLNIRIAVRGTLNSIGSNGILFASGSATPQPQDWDYFSIEGGTATLVETTIKHADIAVAVAANGHLTLQNCYLVENYPTGIDLRNGSLIVNRSTIMVARPPPSSPSQFGGNALYLQGPFPSPIWINESIIRGGDAADNAWGGYGIVLWNSDNRVGIVGNLLIAGGNGGNSSIAGSHAGYGGYGIYSSRIPNFDDPPGLNISHNSNIMGGDGGHSFALNDSQSGGGGQGIDIGDNDNIGSINISNNALIAGGRGGDSFSDYNSTFWIGEGGIGVTLYDIRGNSSVLASNYITGGRGGDNGGKGNSSIWFSAGYGGEGLDLHQVSWFLIENNEVYGGNGGTNFDTGEYVSGGYAGRGIRTWMGRDVTLRSNHVTGGRGGDTYWGASDMNRRDAGGGGAAADLRFSNAVILDSNLTGGTGGDTYGKNSTGGNGGYAIYVTNELGPNITGGVLRGGKGGDNYNDSAVGAGWPSPAVRLYRASYSEIQGAEIYGGDGGDNFAGTTTFPIVGAYGVVFYNATHVDMHDNPIIAAGNGGIDYVDWDNASSGDTGFSVGTRCSDIQIRNNTVTNHRSVGIAVGGLDVEVSGNVVVGGRYGIDTWRVDWLNSTDNQLVGNADYGIEISGSGNVTSRYDRIVNSGGGVHLVGTNYTYFDNTAIEGAYTGVNANSANNAFFENCSLSGGSYTWYLSSGTVVSLNTTFNSTDITPIAVDGDSKLTVMNYLDVGVADSAMAPVPNADVQVTDNGVPTYSTSGFGGLDPQTSADGTVKWLVATDRIYYGSDIPTENTTVATVSALGKTFIDNARDVNMSYSHQETFYEYGAEIFPPEIYNVRVNGSVEIFVMAGTPVELTAIVDDTNGGNSNIASANYTRGPKNWPGNLMVAQDAIFDEPTEGVWAGIDTTGWSPGRYEMWVYACDMSWCNETGDFAIINIVGDIWPPYIQNVLIDGQLSKTVAAGTVLTLTATISDSLTGGSVINYANYTFGPTNWSSSAPMIPSDGTFDTSIEDIEASINTAGWACGIYDLYVYGSDSIGNDNTTSTANATIIVNVCDTQPPEITNLAIDGQPGTTYSLSSLPFTITLTATIDDSNTGNTNIGGANYTIALDGWPGTDMLPSDGSFDSAIEDAYALISTPSSPGMYWYYVYAWDDLTIPNYNNSAPSVWLEIVDDIAPRTENVLLDGAISLNINQGDPVLLTATIYDTFTGDSAIKSANYTLGKENWPGAQMNATDGAFDSSTEDVTITLDTSAFPAGTHFACVYGVDAADNGNITCDDPATLSVTIPDFEPPIVSQVLANGSATFNVPQGGIVNLTAFVDDTTTGNSDILTANYTDGPANWPSSTLMMALDGSFDSPRETVKADIDTSTWSLGTHQLCVYAGDAWGNNATSPQCAEINILGMVPPTASGSPTGTGILVTTNVTVVFSKPMNMDITNTSFTMTDFQSTWDHLNGAIIWTDNGKMFTFDPSLLLTSNTVYLVVLDGSVAKDAAGMFLDGNADGAEGDNYSFWFRTEVIVPVDDDPPEGSSPIGGDTDVPVSTRVIAVEFDEEMNEDSVGVEIEPDTEIEDTSWSGNTLYIILSDDLEPDTEYTVRVSGAEDSHGNPLDVNGDGIPDPGTDLTFTFDTGPKPEVTAPAEFDMGWIVVIVLAIVVVLLLILLIRKPKPQVFKPLEEKEAVALIEEEAEEEELEEV